VMLMHECRHVILLHGLGRNASIMQPMAEYLSQQGYIIHNIDYSPTTLPMNDLCERVRQLVEQLHLNEPCMVVAHSLGSIILRFLLEAKTFPFPVNRCVLLGPPSQGSKLVQSLKSFPLYRKLYRGAGQEIGCDHESISKRLPLSIPCHCGIVSGEGVRFKDYVFAHLVLPLLLKRRVKSDGKLTTEEQGLPGVPQVIVKEASHSSLPANTAVQEHVLSFLKRGSFTFKSPSN